ncbi:SPO22-domain-containing protein [Hymenopellis radicata]|nr:SPO22-domain-containing protein [Hymenopellis radicata]
MSTSKKRKNGGNDGLQSIKVCSFGCLRLVEAGLEPRPGIESLLHVLQLASKTGATLSENGRNDLAGSVLTSAAKFEELLRNADDPEGTHRQARACAIVVYFSARMEAASKEGNYTVAEFMAQKITGDEQRLSLLPAHDRSLLALKFHEIGRTLLPTNHAEAVGWLQKAFSLSDCESESDGADIGGKLKISILRTLARAYFLSGSYDQAEATLDELIPSINAAPNAGDPESSGYQELRWLRLAILKRRKANESALLNAFKSIVDHMELTEASLTDVLQDLRTISHQHALVTAVHRHCLQRASTETELGTGITDRLLLSLIVHCARDEDQTRALGVLDSAFTSLCEADYELPSVAATACLTLLWQYGDRHYNAKRWPEAAEWFVAGSHKLLRTNSPSSVWAKCFRKAALSYVEHREFAKASALVRRCPLNEAATHYVMFLTAVHQGIDDEAIKAVQEMVKCPDFDRRMLLLATQLSHQSENRLILLAALKALLNTLKVPSTSGGETLVEAMTLIRCILKLVLRLLTETSPNKPILIDTLLEHFRRSKVFVETARTQKTINLISKDVSWLWRTAYNCAVQGCSEWTASHERISDLFDMARDLLEICCQSSPVEVDAEVYMHLSIASFSGVSGRVFAFRQARQDPTDDVVDEEKARNLTVQLEACRKRIQEISEKGVVVEEGDASRLQYFTHTLRVFEVELLALLKDWDGMSSIVGDAVSAGPLAASTYEAITDVLWAEKDCPVDVLYGSLEAILRASLDHNSLSIDKFSRWLRAICTIMLARNSATDRSKAIGYVEQAVSVIEQSIDSEEAYPMDERFWLLSTSYNTGFECLEASALDEAKRWFESSTVICRFVPGGKERAEKLSVDPVFCYLEMYRSMKRATTLDGLITRTTRTTRLTTIVTSMSITGLLRGGWGIAACASRFIGRRMARFRLCGRY